MKRMSSNIAPGGFVGRGDSGWRTERRAGRPSRRGWASSRAVLGVIGLLWLPWPVVAESVGSVTVHVTDEQGENLPEARVMVWDNRLGTLQETFSDESGEATIRFLPSGPFTLIVEAEEREGRSESPRCFRVEVGQDVKMEVVLRPSKSSGPPAKIDCPRRGAGHHVTEMVLR